MFDVELAPGAERDLAKVPQPYRDAIWRGIVGLRSWPDHGADVLPLKGSPRGSYRLRVGPYRAVLAVSAAERRIVVLRIRHRSTVYR
jgi:mRNA-degrading endonuclease RelE of RelBE toxin-antitoxin system